MNKSIKLKWYDRLLIITSALLIIFAICAPMLFTRFSWLPFGDMEELKNYGALGDVIGGIMNPFIAIAVGLITFLAFRIQFLANQQQIQRFHQEQNSRQFENQFYEMLRLHKENVNEMIVHLRDKEIRGRKVFDYFIKDFHLIFTHYIQDKKLFPNGVEANMIFDKIHKLYYLFFFGALKTISRNKYVDEIEQADKVYDDLVIQFKNLNHFLNHTREESVSRSDIENYFGKDILISGYAFGNGNSSALGHYFRHLYQTVKYVANQKEPEDVEDATKVFTLTYEQKRQYLSLLRAQLSNQEQLMLYYNWKSGFGENWENEDKGQHFLTDYRMIKNIWIDDLCHDVFKKELLVWNEVFKEEKDKTISSDYIESNNIQARKYRRKRINRKEDINDELFENPPKPLDTNKPANP